LSKIEWKGRKEWEGGVDKERKKLNSMPCDVITGCYTNNSYHLLCLKT
jgi:hypothetical protein